MNNETVSDTEVSFRPSASTSTV